MTNVVFQNKQMSREENQVKNIIQVAKQHYFNS